MFVSLSIKLLPGSKCSWTQKLQRVLPYTRVTPKHTENLEFPMLIFRKRPTVQSTLKKLSYGKCIFCDLGTLLWTGFFRVSSSAARAETHQPNHPKRFETTVFLLSSKVCGPNQLGKIEMGDDDHQFPVFQAVFRSQNFRVWSFWLCGKLVQPKSKREASHTPHPV